MSPEEAFDKFWSEYPYLQEGQTPELIARDVWLAACKWQGQSIAQGIYEAWFHPADIGG